MFEYAYHKQGSTVIQTFWLFRAMQHNHKLLIIEQSYGMNSQNMPVFVQAAMYVDGNHYKMTLLTHTYSLRTCVQM